jgi:putative ABC transport system permease protein
MAFADRLPPAVRALLRQKRFAALAIVSLGVAIALNTTMYSVTDAILFPRVSMRSPENLYRMPFYGDYKGRVSNEQKIEAMRGLSFFEDIALKVPNFRADNIAERGALLQNVRVLNVSSNYFKLLGTHPLHGRLISEIDVNAGTPAVVVSERLWRQFFPERTAFDTGTFTLDGAPRLVVGVLDYASDFPGERTDVWQLPAGSVLPWQHRAITVFHVVRLKDGLKPEDAMRELNALSARIANMAGEGPREARFDFVRAVGQPMRIANFFLAVVGAVLFVLLVACFNLANLQLARGLSRTRELATRAAVGATRGNLIAQLMQEAAWLTVAGLVLGVLLTFWGIQFIASSVPPSLGEFLIKPQVSWRLFAFAAASGALALGIVGLAPAIRVSRVDVSELIKSGNGTGATRASYWQVGGLVAIQVGLALVLMVGATALIKAAAGLYRLDINPALENVVTSRVGVLLNSTTARLTMGEVSNRVLDRARLVTGVVEAATARMVQPDHQVISIADAGRLAREVKTGNFSYSIVSPSYLRTYGTRILKGRDFRDAERSASVIVDERTARFLWPGADPIGQQIKFGSDSRHDQGWLTVVGVSQYMNTWRNFTRASQEERLAPTLGAILVVNGMDTVRVGKASSLELHLRGSTNMERLPLQVRQTVSDRPNGLVVWYAERLFSSLQLDLVRKRQDFVAAMFTTFALIALGLSALGVYAVVSHAVTTRTREFGVRLALGATAKHIRQSVLYYGNVMALSGIVIGLVLAAMSLGWLSGVMLEDDRWNNRLFAIAAVVLFGATLLASYLPARRAMKIDPVEALRHE